MRLLCSRACPSKLAAVISLKLVPEVAPGWRALFWTASGISVFGAFLRSLLPESEAFLKVPPRHCFCFALWPSLRILSPFPFPHIVKLNTVARFPSLIPASLSLILLLPRESDCSLNLVAGPPRRRGSRYCFRGPKDARVHPRDKRDAEKALDVVHIRGALTYG